MGTKLGTPARLEIDNAAWKKGPAGAGHLWVHARQWLLVLVLLGLFVIPAGAARAQSQGGFDPQTGVIEPVKTVTVQAGGKVLIGGAFLVGTTHGGIARLNADGRSTMLSSHRRTARFSSSECR